MTVVWALTGMCWLYITLYLKTKTLLRPQAWSWTAGCCWLIARPTPSRLWRVCSWSSPWLSTAPRLKAVAHSSPLDTGGQKTRPSLPARPRTSLIWWCSSGVHRQPVNSPRLLAFSRCCTALRRDGGASFICTDDMTSESWHTSGNYWPKSFVLHKKIQFCHMKILQSYSVHNAKISIISWQTR